MNVDRLKPFFERLGTAPAPGLVLDAGRKVSTRWSCCSTAGWCAAGVMRYLVRWRGHTSADDEWLRAEELTHCQEKVEEYNATAPRRRAARRADPAAEPAAPPPAPPPPALAPAALVPPAGFRVAALSEGLTGTALVGQVVLYHCIWNPDEVYSRYIPCIYHVYSERRYIPGISQV